VKCVYAGANTPMISIDPEKKDYSGKNILFVGLDWERKGGPELVEAFLRINEKHPDATLTIVGNPPEFKKPGIISAGRVPVDRLNDYYREATVFCMPSHNEPFGIVFVEAMVHALPIVATNIGAIPDMVKPKKNGILVEAGDAEGLANALDELISSESNRRQFGRQSYLLSKKYYNWQAVGRKMRHAILSVVKE